MGWASGSGGRRWTRRSCRTGEGGGVVRRTVAAAEDPSPAPASGVSAARRRTEGFAHVDKQRRVNGVSYDFRCSTGSITQDDTLSWDVGEFKHKSSHRNSIRCIPDVQTDAREIAWPRPSVMAGSYSVRGVLADSLSQPREKKISACKELLHAESNVSGLPTQPSYRLINHSNSMKPPTVKSCSSLNDFRHQVFRIAERSASTKVGSASASSSLSEKMSLLCQPQNARNYQSRSRIYALNRRHKNVNSKGEINLLSEEKVHDQPDYSLSLGGHSKAIVENALVRQNQLCYSEPLSPKTLEQFWSATCSSTSIESIDDFQVSSSSDTSDNSSLSYLGVIAKDQWKITSKKVYCALAEHLGSVSVIYRKEIGQASPVSVLEPLSEDCSDSENIKRKPADPYDLQLRLEVVKFPPLETATDTSSTAGTSDLLSSEMEQINDELIELV